jgi:hypothetical protein
MQEHLLSYALVARLYVVEAGYVGLSQGSIAPFPITLTQRYDAEFTPK